MLPYIALEISISLASIHKSFVKFVLSARDFISSFFLGLVLSKYYFWVLVTVLLQAYYQSQFVLENVTKIQFSYATELIKFRKNTLNCLRIKFSISENLKHSENNSWKLNFCGSKVSVFCRRILREALSRLADCRRTYVTTLHSGTMNHKFNLANGIATASLHDRHIAPCIRHHFLTSGRLGTRHKLG